MPIRNPDHNQMWLHQNFPNRKHDNEQISFVVRQDVSKITESVIGVFALFIVIMLGKSFLLNGFGSVTNVYLAEGIFYAFMCFCMLSLAYQFHNYFLSFWAFTTDRIIHHTQNNLVNADLSQIWYKDIDKIEAKLIDPTTILINQADLVITLKVPKDSEKPAQQIVLAKISEPIKMVAQIQTLINQSK
jgi:hypothetical protein